MFWGEDKMICDKNAAVPCSDSFYKAGLSIIFLRNRNDTLNLPCFEDCSFSGLGDSFGNSSFVFGPRYSRGDYRWFGLLVCFSGFFWENGQWKTWLCTVVNEMNLNRCSCLKTLCFTSFTQLRHWIEKAAFIGAFPGCKQAFPFEVPSASTVM